MSGEGGTGKSQVILAIINYFALNNRSKSLLVSAPTGSAACLINGMLNQKYFKYITLMLSIIKNVQSLKQLQKR